uniref:Uncharacterized protein n=1 Tax=Terrapene triunguis TaxID=2587831 RepID=A0A674IAP7_9SAUR
MSSSHVTSAKNQAMALLLLSGETITRSLSPLSLFNGSEMAVKRFLPKSHLSTVIIRDNTSVQRIQEIKVNHLEETRIKTSHFYEHLKKKFTSDQQKKISRWKKELQSNHLLTFSLLS